MTFSRIGALSVVLGLITASAYAADPSADTEVRISLKDDGVPASDLLYTDPAAPAGTAPRVLSPIEAWNLKTQKNVDLSALDPDASTDEWPGVSTAQDESLDQALPIASGPIAQEVKFLGVITSSTGRLRFNVQTEPASAQSAVTTYTLMLGRDLHTYLLRKELLRRLGYRVPALKYLPRIQVRFPDAATRDFFLNTQIPNATYGAATRWQVTDSSATADPLVITFQDLALMEATPLYYNLALGPPIEFIPGTTQLRPETPRILRALAVPYALANLPESVNQYDWYLGRTDNGSLVLETTDLANFATTLDDAVWMLRRLARLTRDDFTQAVAASYFPDAVAQVLVEKLVARRDSILGLFNVPAPKLPFQDKLSIGSAVKDGKIMQQDWPGYASRYAFGDPASPLSGLKWYLLSLAESNAMENLVNWANSQLPSWTTTADDIAHQKQLLTNAFNQFFTTGQIQAVPFGTWVAPILNGGIQISRDAVIGNYLGTNNLVQLADTFGLSVTAGFMVGVDGLPAFASVQGVVEGTVKWSLTHIKPLTGMKQAVTEPIKNVLVPWVFLSAADALKKIAAEQSAAGQISQDDLKKALAADLDSLKSAMGVGESLILTVSLAGVQGVSGGIEGPVPIAPEAIAQAGINELVMIRMHFYRSDANTIQVYKDNGDLIGLNAALTVTAGGEPQFPVLSLSAAGALGDAKTEVFSVNVNPDPSTNPGIYSAASAIAAALRTGSAEMLEATLKPADISVKFKDSSAAFQLLHFMSRSIKQNGQVHIQLPDGSQGDYVSLTQGSQKGEAYQKLAGQAATFIVEKLAQDGSFGIGTPESSNPGESFLGQSTTRRVDFQAMSSPAVTMPWLRILYLWQGWQMKADDLRALGAKLSTQYGWKLYADGFLGDAQDIKLYEVSMAVNLYADGIASLMGLSPADEKALVSQVTALHQCDLYEEFQWDTLSGDDEHICAQLDDFQDALDTHRDNLKNPDKAVKDPSREPQAIMKAVSSLEQVVDFPTLVKLAGGPSHLFARSVMTGFRDGSETLSAPIFSNTYGVVDPVFPNGALSGAQQILGIGDGEFDFEWLRDVL